VGEGWVGGWVGVGRVRAGRREGLLVEDRIRSPDIYAHFFGYFVRMQENCEASQPFSL
jgi:hypothetical protein